jgi:hypothetical protein
MMITIVLGEVTNKKIGKFTMLLIKSRLTKQSNYLKIQLNLVKKKNMPSNKKKYSNHKKLWKPQRCSLMSMKWKELYKNSRVSQIQSMSKVIMKVTNKLK